MRQSAFLFILLAGMILPVASWADSPDGNAPSAATTDPAPTTNNSSSATMENLVNLMVSKGVLTAGEAAQLRAMPTGQQVAPLLSILAKKGVLTQEEVASLSSPIPATVAVSVPAQNVVPSQPVAAKPPAMPPAIAAVAPLRVLPIDPPKKDGLIPDLKVGPVKMKPYGMIKASAIYDSSSPRGDDMPIPFYIFGDSGPDASPEFRMKARFLRLGSNFEWPDVSKRLTFTGRFEFDFEGNFTKTDNRNISSVRSSQASIRQAWGRLDYAADENDTLFAQFGQDWTPFGSSTLPNLVETTGLGLGFGTLYERAPLMRTGWIHNFGGSRNLKFSPEFAVVLPAYGNTPSAVDVQLSTGERQGTDSGRPDLQGRFVTQFQLDKAPAVAPAQLIMSWIQGRRETIVRAADIPAAFRTAYPTGARVGNDRWGITAEVQLPTRYVTILGKWFTGTDLRWYFVGQLFSHYNETAGLTGVVTAPSIDGSDTVAFGFQNGAPVIAPQGGVRTTGGFVNLSFPLSRILHADPTGRNTGWTLYLHYATDQAKARDVRMFSAASGNRVRSDLAAANIQYKINPLITLAFEQSQYKTWAIPSAAGVYPLFAGAPSRKAKDNRSEFSTIFTF